MLEALLATVVGFITGFVFSLLKLPVPAPATFSGVMGVLGIFLGFLAAKALIKN
ncbi:DUF1427 family protein [Coprothermobacteraceae bacterium]|nr:DUF1427 family protein [Coprothermobacteraceae bacterium]